MTADSARRRYHVPDDIAVPEGMPPAQARRLAAIVTAAIRRAVSRAAPDEQAHPVPETRPRPRQRVADTGRDTYAIASYADKGKEVVVPVAAGAQPPVRGSRASAPQSVEGRLLLEAQRLLKIDDEADLVRLWRVVTCYTDSVNAKAFAESLRREGLDRFLLQMRMRLVGTARPAPSADLGAATIDMLFGREESPRDPGNPVNTLTAFEMFILWRDHWIAREHAAAGRYETIRKAIWRADPVKYANDMYLYSMGRRDALGPEFAAADNEFRYYQAVLRTGRKVRAYLNFRETTHSPVTFDALNEQTAVFVRDQAFEEAVIDPMLWAVIGQFSAPGAGRAEPARTGRPPSRPETPSTVAPGTRPPGRVVETAPAGPAAGEPPAVTPQAPARPATQSATQPAPVPAPTAPRSTRSRPETVEEFQARGGKITKVPARPASEQPTVRVADKNLPEGTHREVQGKDLKKDTTRQLTPPEALGESLEAAGYHKPAANFEAHHMVLRNDSRVAAARRVLDRAGIHLDSAENGVWLPRVSRNTGRGGTEAEAFTDHDTIHTDRYCDYLNKRFTEAGPDGARKALNDVRQALMDGRAPR